MREYVLTLLVTAAVTYLLTPLVQRVAIKIGAVPAIRDRDVHQVPIPRMGGLAMFGGVAAGILVAGQLEPLRGVFNDTNLLSGLMLASALIVAVGIIDDRWGMNAIGKLSGQVAAGAILAYSGAELDTFPLPKGGTLNLSPNESVALTILVVVATINAVNLIDGLDGLAAGIVCIAAASFFSYYYTLTKVVHLSSEGVPALASVVLAGACIGFLPHNFYPAKIIMGDTGAMLLGLLLAYVPISALSSLTYSSLTNGHATVNRFPDILPLLMPAAALVIPYTDMLRAVVRRARAGKPLFSADREHLHHRLLDIGHSHRRSVLILYLWAALFSGTVVGLSLVGTQLVVFGAVTVAAVLALVLLSMPRLQWWNRDRDALGATGSSGTDPQAGTAGLVSAVAAPRAMAAGAAGVATTAPVAQGAAAVAAGNGAAAHGPAAGSSAPGPEQRPNLFSRASGPAAAAAGYAGNGAGIAGSAGTAGNGAAHAGGAAGAGQEPEQPGPPWALSESATWRESSGT